MKNLDVKAIERHLNNKGKYRRSYIDRVCLYMDRNPDLAHEFKENLPKNHIPDEYITVRGVTAKELGIATMLSRSAIYVVLARLREEKTAKAKIINEELANLKYGSYS